MNRITTDSFDDGRLTKAEAAVRRLSVPPGPSPEIAARTLAALAEPRVTSHYMIWKEGLSMKQRIACSSIGLAAVVLLAAWLTLAGRTPSALAQVAAKIREAKSFSCETVMEMDGKPLPAGKFYWRAPGTVRLEETALPAGNTVVSIFPYHESGIEIDEINKTFTRLPARKGYTSPLMAVWKLGGFSGQADKELEPRKIGDRQTRGFQIAAEKVDPGLKGTLDIWTDVETQLPAVLEYRPEQADSMMQMHNFQWNVPLDSKLFNTQPPEGYADKTPKPPTLEEKVGHITEALTFYSEVMGGHYPRVKMVYGDVTLNELWKKLGIDTRRLSEEQLKSNEYVRGIRATNGFAWINSILRDNADAAYYGKSVGPADKEKVLLRWKLDDGSYHVVYGDLHDETVTAERLKTLESR